MKIQTIRIIAVAALFVCGITDLDAKHTKKAQVSKKQTAKDKLNYDKAFKKIKAAVKAGKLSGEEADKKMIAIKKSQGSKKKSEQKNRQDAIIRKIKAAFDAGKISKEEASKKFTSLKKEWGKKKKGRSKKSKSKRK